MCVRYTLGVLDTQPRGLLGEGVIFRHTFGQLFSARGVVRHSSMCVGHTRRVLDTPNSVCKTQLLSARDCGKTHSAYASATLFGGFSRESVIFRHAVGQLFRARGCVSHTPLQSEGGCSTLSTFAGHTCSPRGGVFRRRRGVGPFSTRSSSRKPLQCGEGLGNFSSPRGKVFRHREGMSYLRPIRSCITQPKDHRPSRTCDQSKEEEKEGMGVAWGCDVGVRPPYVWGCKCTPEEDRESC